MNDDKGNTMKLKELKKQYEKLGEEIKRLENKGCRFLPSEYEMYFFVNNGRVDHKGWIASDFDLWQMSQGNVFWTPEEAQRHGDKLRLIAEIKEFAGHWRPDIKNKEQNRFFIYYNIFHNGWFVDDTMNVIDIGQIYFQTEDRAEEAIKYFGDRLDLLLD